MLDCTLKGERQWGLEIGVNTFCIMKRPQTNAGKKVEFNDNINPLSA